MITLSFKDMAAPVTDEERKQINDLVTNAFDNHSAVVSLNERNIFIMMTLVKEQQDALFEINKSL